MSDSTLTQHFEDNARRYNDLAKGPAHEHIVSFNRLYNLASELTSNLATVSRALDTERAQRMRFAHALVSLAESLKRPGKANDAEIAYYTHLIDAISDLTT